LKNVLLTVGAVVLLALVGWTAYYVVATDRSPSLCAALYAETGEERYRGASWWTCYWAEKRHLAKNSENIAKIAAANVVERDRLVAATRARAASDAELIAELRRPVCVVLAKWRDSPGVPADQVLEVDLMGLSGHSSLFAVEPACRNCADMMATFYDATGARFCDVGGIAGKTCGEAKPYAHTGGVHREGTRDALWSELGCK
jgi:hypothetical protein